MFRDKTKEVMRRARSTALSGPKALLSISTQPLPASEAHVDPELEDEGLSLVGYQHNTGETPLTYSYSLTPTIDERAERFFFTHYVVGMATPSGAFSENPTSLKMDKILRSSMKAVGLAGYASFVSAPELITQAKQHYVAAIQLTNAALRSSIEAKKDSTLLSVMILSLFEIITGRNERSIAAWKNHNLGCAALLHIRGKEQLAIPRGRHMFMQVTSTLAIGCLSYNMELPCHLFELREEAGKYFEPDSLVYRYQGLEMQLTNFHARVRRGRISDPDQILIQALDLDQAFVLLFLSIPPGSGYETVYTDANPQIIFAGYYHVYGDSLSAQMWNGMRCFRIILNEMIRDVLLAGFSAQPPRFLERRYLEQFLTSTEALYQLQSDIIASVPQYMGYVSTGSDYSVHAHKYHCSEVGSRWAHSCRTISPTGMSSSLLPALRLTGGVLLPWSLFLAGSTDVATEQSRHWVTEILRSLRRVMGIQQAQVLADMIEDRMKIRAQQHQQLGSDTTIFEG